MKMIRKNFYLTETQIRVLKGNKNLSFSEHVRRAIDDYVAKLEKDSVATSASNGKEATN